MRALFVVIAVTSFGCATTAPRAPAHVENAARVERVAPAHSYLGRANLDATKFLARPPERGGPVDVRDLEAVRAAQAQKGTARWSLAQSDDETSPFSAFAAVLGPAFTKDRAPLVAALLDVLFNDARLVTGPTKAAYARDRPPVVDSTLETCKPLENTGSYPSAHATRGWLTALVLAGMVPEKNNEILARGRDYGDSRVFCAEHFPSDVDAGRVVGAAVFAAVTNDARYAADFAAAKAELRAVLALQ